MDQLFAKLTNLSYEVFGILIPGVIFLMFMAWSMWCASELMPVLTFGYVAPFGVRGVASGFALFPDEFKWGFVIYVSVAAYFLGHLLHWVGRLGSADEAVLEATEGPKSFRVKVALALANIRNCLKFAIPKSIHGHSASLTPLLNDGYVFLRIPSQARSWVPFFLVAKSRIAQDVARSLVSTYQNKYTLHRALAVASVVWFWMSYFQMFFALTLLFTMPGTEPHWIPLLVSMVASLITMWGFSESYRFHWVNFGNAIITEIYMLSRRVTHDQ